MVWGSARRGWGWFLSLPDCRLVQPISEPCVGSLHRGTRPLHRPDLRPDLNTQFIQSAHTLHKKTDDGRASLVMEFLSCRLFTSFIILHDAMGPCDMTHRSSLIISLSGYCWISPDRCFLSSGDGLDSRHAFNLRLHKHLSLNLSLILHHLK